jgi:hypothetical protein
LGQGSETEHANQIDELIRQLRREHALINVDVVVSLHEIGPSAVPALVAALANDDVVLRTNAAEALGKLGPKAAPAVPALVTALSDEMGNVHNGAATALIKIGRPSVPALVSLLSDEIYYGYPFATLLDRIRSDRVLGEIGTTLKRQGSVLWWVVPRVYWKALVGILLSLVSWFALAARFPRHRPVSGLRRVALLTLTAAVPNALVCGAVGYAVTREWAQGFLPEALTLVPFPIAAVLSTALVITLPAIWVCGRKTLTPGADPATA